MLIVFSLYLIVLKILFEKGLKKRIKQNRKKKRKEAFQAEAQLPSPRPSKPRPSRAAGAPPFFFLSGRQLGPAPSLTATWDPARSALLLPARRGRAGHQLPNRFRDNRDFLANRVHQAPIKGAGLAPHPVFPPCREIEL